ncbi:hypothetical protein C8Q78DRAFT_1047124 [Trametes maxima]|nr:hypothetical protein C8Q78DRAFT_1047124 [Trametes maxima]
MPVENHPLQKTFHPAKTDELRNKAGRCKTCDRAREPPERFRVCSGCQVALYCGEECQRADWPSHKFAYPPPPVSRLACPYSGRF